MYKPDTIIPCPVCNAKGYVDNTMQNRHEVTEYECPICKGEYGITMEEWTEIPDDYDPIEDIRDSLVMAAEYALEGDR